MASVLPPMCASDTGDQQPQKQSHGKRLTMVERARLEALAAFGNTEFDSLSMKKDDFHSKLQSSVTKTSSTNQQRALTRLERAKLEANSAFKNIKLGQMVQNRKKRKLQENDSENKVPKKKNMTRLQKAKVEVDKAFENVSLSTIPKKRSRLEEEKIISSYRSKNDAKKPEKLCVSGGLPASTRRITRSQSAQLAAVKTCKGNDLETSPLSDINEQSVLSDTKDKKSSNKTAVKQRKLNMIEKAKLEAIDSFKGEHFEEICKESKKIVAKYFNPKLSKHKPDAQVTPSLKEHTGPQLMQSHNKQTTPALTAQSLDRNKDTEVTSKQRIDNEISPNQKQKCMATPIQSSSNKQAVQACSMPSKLNTEKTRLTPATSHRERRVQPNIDVYSSIKGDENFNNHTVLLETSKRVVETAISLETPEGSPMVTTNK